MVGERWISQDSCVASGEIPQGGLCCYWLWNLEHMEVCSSFSVNLTSNVKQLTDTMFIYNILKYLIVDNAVIHSIQCSYSHLDGSLKNVLQWLRVPSQHKLVLNFCYFIPADCVREKVTESESFCLSVCQRCFRNVQLWDTDHCGLLWIYFTHPHHSYSSKLFQ